MRAVMKRNTDKEYPCVNCGSINANIVREGDDPRLKCNECGIMFDGSASLEAKEADAIPDSAPEIAEDNPREVQPRGKERGVQLSNDLQPLFDANKPKKIPRYVDYVFISKDRKQYEFISERDLKKIALKWESEGKKYELYQLTSKKSSVKVDIE